MFNPTNRVILKTLMVILELILMQNSLDEHISKKKSVFDCMDLPMATN